MRGREWGWTSQRSMSRRRAVEWDTGVIIMNSNINSVRNSVIINYGNNDDSVSDIYIRPSSLK